MKFVCLGYADLKKMHSTPPEEMAVMFEECMRYDDELRRGGHFIGGEALMPHMDARTVRPGEDGGVFVTDGPYAETKEQLGGILLLEARDMAHAVELMSKHPGVKYGPFEIRPANVEVNELIRARNKKYGT
ncbi:MAG: YciI family protein [Planctomycetales bacterium]|nr:YciI family protein [Planctomycetales bacterium]MBN8629118.1 YciI family protein [Planctomycetota bacterium]